jgi:hypothetical protein
MPKECVHRPRARAEGLTACNRPLLCGCGVRVADGREVGCWGMHKKALMCSRCCCVQAMATAKVSVAG